MCVDLFLFSCNTLANTREDDAVSHFGGFSLCVVAQTLISVYAPRKPLGLAWATSDGGDDEVNGAQLFAHAHISVIVVVVACLEIECERALSTCTRFSYSQTGDQNVVLLLS